MPSHLMHITPQRRLTGALLDLRTTSHELCSLQGLGLFTFGLMNGSTSFFFFFFILGGGGPRCDLTGSSLVDPFSRPFTIVNADESVSVISGAHAYLCIPIFGLGTTSGFLLRWWRP